MSQMPVIQKKDTSTRKLLFMGMKLGFLGSLWGSYLFLIFYVLVLSVSAALQGQRLVSKSFITDRHGYFQLLILAYFTLGFLITFFVMIVPTILAGISNTWVLNLLQKAGALTASRGILIGAILGGIFCLLSVLGIQLIIPILFSFRTDVDYFRGLLEIAGSGILTAAIVGSWHSLKIYRYLTSPA